MSRISRRLRRATRGETGFTLVEVMAAMVVFAIVATAVTAMFMSGLRASLLTKMDTTAKNLSQQRFEAIRNLPYHIDQVSTGNNPPDLLDVYYRDTLTASPGRGKTGFVSASATRWTADGDPATGAFYRYVEEQLPNFPKFKQYVATQFLDDDGDPFSPASFNSQAAGFDQPPTLSVGVSVTTLWKAGKLDRVQRTYSQVTAGRPTAPNALLQSRLTAVRITGGLGGGTTVTVDLGALTADGSVSRTVSAAQSVKAASLALSTAAAVNGAVTSVKAPPNSGVAGSSSGPRTLLDGSNVRAHVGTTRTNGVSATSSTGQVVLSSAGSPARADLLGGGVGEKIAHMNVDANVDPRFEILNGAHAYVEDAGCGTSCSNAGVSGYANTAASSTGRSTTTSANAFVRGALVVLPTTYAPLGLVRVTVTSATVSCMVTRSNGSNPVATANISYSGSLSYWSPYSPSAVAGYVTIPLSSSDTASPLTPGMLSTTQVGTDSNGNPLWLSDYISSWTSMDTSTVQSAKTFGSDGSTVSTSFSGMIGVTTVPLRAGDESSVVAAQIAPGGCTAEDYR